MPKKESIDMLDRRILALVMNDARMPLSDISTKLSVSNATIHVRLEKLRNLGVIKGVKTEVDYKLLGYDVCCFIGLHLSSAKDAKRVTEKLNAMQEVIEVYYTTGNYNLFAKVVVRSLDNLHSFMASKLQQIKEVYSTETIISLSNPVHRDILPDK